MKNKLTENQKYKIINFTDVQIVRNDTVNNHINHTDKKH